jgi:glycine betaine/proline transport system permease protein
VLDRVSRGFAEAYGPGDGVNHPFAQRGQLSAAFLGAAILLVGLAQIVEPFRSYPQGWTIYPADFLNSALNWFTVTFFPLTSAIKTTVLLYLLLPLRIGLAQSMQPALWGISLGPPVIASYLVVAGAMTGAAYLLSGSRAALGVLFAFLLYFYGTTGMPWLVLSAIICALAYEAGGLRTCALVAVGIAFIALTGSWPQAMVTLQLCGAGVIFSFVLGSSLGIWASENDRLSSLLRPICDTLQTMPIFVFLIPAIMVFLVGEFTALVAIVAYATVPSIRFTEHGLRSVPESVVEAARTFGATRLQLLWQVKLPMALPEIMLGLNQTIMMGLAMVIVAALVGAKGLGTDIMVALNEADPGAGAVSGLCVAIIAISADRIIRAWVDRSKQSLGLD